MFVLANLNLIVVSIIYSALLRLKSKSSYLISLYLIAFSILVFSFELASLFHQINRLVVVAIQFALGLLGGFLWIIKSRPPLLGPFVELGWQGLKKELNSFSELLATSKDLITLVSFVFIILGINLLIAIITPPFNFDILAYHLPRIVYWLKNQSLVPWHTFDLRQTTFPPNSEIGLLWIFIWTKSDALLWMVQSVSLVISVIALFKLSRMLGFSWQRALFSSFIWITLSQIFFQAFSLQNDLVITCIALCMVILFFDGLVKENIGEVLLSGIAFGLGLGTKFTFLFLLPAWGILIFYLYLKQPKVRRMLYAWASSGAFAFALFGSYIYIQNYTYYGNLFGPPEPVSIVSGTDNISYRLELLRDNFGRYLYQSMEVSPIPEMLRVPFVEMKNSVFDPIYSFLGINVESQRTVLDRLFEYETFITYMYPGLPEDSAWFGPLLILFIPVFSIRIFKAIRTRNFMHLSLIFLFMFFFITQAALQPWTYYKSRYLIIPITLVFPFFSDLYVESSKSKLFKVGNYLIIFVAILVSLLNTSIHPYRNLSNLIYLTQGERVPPLWYKLPIYFAVDKYVPQDEKLGTYYSEFYTRFVDHEKEESYPIAGDYPLFGTKFARSVIPLGDIKTIPDDINYLFVASVYAKNSREIQSEFILLEESNNISLYQRVENYTRK